MAVKKVVIRVAKSINACRKTVTPQDAYEVWEVQDHPEYGGLWRWFVVKKYQAPDKEAQNTYAAWHCFVQSPYCPDGEYGDTYIKDIRAAGAQPLATNPLTGKPIGPVQLVADATVRLLVPFADGVKPVSHDTYE